MEDLWDKIWAPVVTLVGFIVWLVRLEGRVNTLAKSVDRLEGMALKQIEAMQTLAVMQSEMGHIKTDIKEVKDMLINQTRQ